MGSDFVAPGNPGGAVERLADVFRRANSTLTVAKAARSQMEAFGLWFSHEGTDGHSAAFSWTA